MNTENTTFLKFLTINQYENEFEGIYGKYKVSSKDEIEVHLYRLSLLSCGIALNAGLIQWWILGADWAWVWLILLAISVGLAIRWVHIYMKSIHQFLKLFWFIGCIGLVIMIFYLTPELMLSTIVNEPVWTIAIGPLFASLAGLGVKEFFCFRQLEAVGLAIMLPIALLGHLSELLSLNIVISLMIASSILLFLLALKKFSMETAPDIGDKSIFEFLKKTSATNSI